MRLIDADSLIEAMKKTEAEFDACMICPTWWSAYNVINEQPTAYNVDKVVHKVHCHFIDRIDEASEEETKKLLHDNKVVCGIVRNGGNTSTENINTSTKISTEMI